MYQPIYLSPGVCLNTTPYSAGKEQAYTDGRVASGRYVDMDKIRFVSGFPEKIGGWIAEKQLASGGIAMFEWRDLQNTPRIAIGCYNGLYAYDGTNIVDITPKKMMTNQQVTADITSTDLSSFVVVQLAPANITVGDWINITSTATVGGLTLNGWFYVASVTAATFTIQLGSAASSSQTVSAAALTIQSPRRGETNVMTSTTGSSIVTVTTDAPNTFIGDSVIFTGLYPVGSLTVSGSYTITQVGTDSFSFDTGTVADTGGANAGGTIEFQVNVSVNESEPSTGLYGQGYFGAGLFGKASNRLGYGGIGWVLQAYGQQLLSAPIGGTIYVYDPSVGGCSYPLQNAPISVQGFVVTPERYVIALGINDNFLELAWPDQNDYTDWTTSLTNTAESGRTLQGGRSFVNGVATRNGTTLLFTDRSVFQAVYEAGTYIYSTPMLADNCGIVGPHAAVSYGDVVFWMGSNEFWMFNGAVSAMASDDIRTYVFRNINTNLLWKCHAGANFANKEIWFFYPSAGSDVCDSYVIYHTDQECWSSGSMTRSTWINDDLFANPYACDENGILYQHETGLDEVSLAGAVTPISYTLETSLMDIGTGEVNSNIFGFIPDFARFAATMSLTINTQYYPEGQQNQDGPYVLADTDDTSRIDLRSDGKAFGFTLGSNDQGSDFRLGLCRIDAQQSGARR